MEELERFQKHRKALRLPDSKPREDRSPSSRAACQRGGMGHGCGLSLLGRADLQGNDRLAK